MPGLSFTVGALQRGSTVGQTESWRAGKQHIPDPAHPGKSQTSSVVYKQ